jgi:hypothetical protein
LGLFFARRFFCARDFFWALRRLDGLEDTRWAEIRRGSLTAGCAVALLCVCLVTGSAEAQQTSSPAATPQQKSTSAKAANAKPHTKAPPAKTTASRKPHAASHPATSQHTKSNTALAAHTSKARRVSSRGKTSKKSVKPKGQQKIEPERAQEIQEALIREHYLSGEAAGNWDQASEDAMRKYQADHGWQSKTVPDSRALISLGLGPNHDHLLNPESAMTTGPEGSHAAPVSSTPQNSVSHSADPGPPMDATPARPAGFPPAVSDPQ